MDDLDLRIRLETAQESLHSLAIELAQEAAEPPYTPRTAVLAALVLEQGKVVDRLRRDRMQLVAG